MTVRRRRVADDERHRLAAVRRAQDLAGLPARASIGAIEIELRTLGWRRPTAAATGEYRNASGDSFTRRLMRRNGPTR